jgi:L-methionine (R)-S-oxide reductase
MHEVTAIKGLPKPETYREMNSQLEAVLAGERDGLANTANMAALIHQMLPDLNWAGFYFLRGGELVVGPFQGRVACVRIALGKGVCGTSAQTRAVIVVPDVHEFPGHIACDPRSRSEIVVPIVRAGALVGVLDLDSPLLARFDGDDAAGLSAAVATLVRESDFRGLYDGAAPR